MDEHTSYPGVRKKRTKEKCVNRCYVNTACEKTSWKEITVLK